MKLSIIPAALDFLREGEVVSDPKLWKIGGEALKAAIVATILSLNPLLTGLGYDFQIPIEVAGSIGLVVVWVVGLFFTAATSPTVGLLPAKVVGPTGDAPAGGQGSLGAPVGGGAADRPNPMEVRLRPPSNQEDAG